MDERINRRRFLATATATSSLLAGCSGGGDADTSPSDTTESTPTPTDSPTATERTDSSTGTEEESGTAGRIVPPAIDYGELITDFRGNRWSGLRGETLTLDQEHAVSGKHALRVENSDNNLSTLAFTPTTPITLEGRDLSMAVKVEAPVGGRIEVRLRSPNQKNRYVCTRRLPAMMDDWMRIDFGITRGWNSPDISDIKEIRIGMKGSKGSEIKYWLDDIRATESAGTPHAILAFYGGYESQYESAFPLLQERGMTGVVPVIPSTIGDEGRMDLGQLRELRDAGWDVSPFPLRDKPLPEMSAEKQREIITRVQKLLSDKGFEDGARHFFSPTDSLDGETMEIIREIHETAFVYGGGSANVPPTAPYTIPEINGFDYDSSRDVILRANKHDQVVTLVFEEIGTEDGMSVEEFEKQLDRIENNAYAGGLNVITPSELVEKYL